MQKVTNKIKRKSTKLLPNNTMKKSLRTLFAELTVCENMIDYKNLPVPSFCKRHKKHHNFEVIDLLNQWHLPNEFAVIADGNY